MKHTDHPFHRNRHQKPPGVRLGELTREVARPSVTGLRQVWTPSVTANGLTPQRLAMILRNAEMGFTRPQLELAEAMEERDPHYGSVLRTRRLAIQGLEVTVESHSDTDADVALATAVRDLVRRPAFDELLDDLTDAIGKGFAAVEILWQRGATWEPHYAWRDPCWFNWDRDTGCELRLLDESAPAEGLALAAYKWIIHVPRIKSGLPARSGLARLAAFAYMCKTWALKDWMAFADTYGLPLRVGKYGPSATPEDIQTLVNAVANIASDAGAVIPESMLIEFIGATAGGGGGSGGGDGIFSTLAQYLDAQISKAVLGHTGASDSTPGRLGGEDQAADVRLDILKADAKQLAATLNRDLVRPYIDLNFGVQQHYPKLCLPVPEPEDIKLLIEGLEKLVPLGLEVEQSVIRDKLGLPDPELDAQDQPVGKLLRPPSIAPLLPQAGDVASQRAAARQQRLDRDELDGLTDQLALSADRRVSRWLAELQDIIDAAIADGAALADLQRVLLEKFTDLDPSELAAVMGEALVAAELAGRVAITEGV